MGFTRVSVAIIAVSSLFAASAWAKEGTSLITQQSELNGLIAGASATCAESNATAILLKYDPSAKAASSVEGAASRCRSAAQAQKTYQARLKTLNAFIENASGKAPEGPVRLAAKNPLPAQIQDAESPPEAQKMSGSAD